MANEPNEFGNIKAILEGIALEAHHAYSDAPGNFVPGLSTGIKVLDEITFGLHPGELIVMGSRPNMGAHPLAQRILLHVACELNRPVIFISLVNRPNEVANQLLSIAANVNWFRVKKGGALDERWDAISDAFDQLFQQPIAIESLKADQFEDILRMAKHHSERTRERLGLIVIHGFEHSIFSDDKLDQNTAGRTAVFALRALAQDLQVPILLLVNLDRRIEERQDRTPVLGDLPRIGHLENLADSILLISCDRLYSPESGKENLVVVIPKSLHGFVGTCCLDPAQGLFGQE